MAKPVQRSEPPPPPQEPTRVLTPATVRAMVAQAEQLPVAQRGKKLKQMQLMVHPDKGGTKELFLIVRAAVERMDARHHAPPPAPAPSPSNFTPPPMPDARS